MGKIYIVGTPIGNLLDITYRAIEIMKSSDFIAAEDTRVTRKLLNHYNIDIPTISYHGNNEYDKSVEIIDKVLNGENCCLVSDAGMPCISDPGEILVRRAIDKGIDIQVVPGPNAAISGLCISGISTSKFHFEGFLSMNKKNRFESLNRIKEYPYTLIFYEAPHKLLSTLEDILEILGERYVSVIKEMTKIHESVNRNKLSSLISYYRLNKPRGEYVLIVEGKKNADNISEYDFNDALDMLNKLILKGVKLSDASKQVARITGFKKSELYKKFISFN